MEKAVMKKQLAIQGDKLDSLNLSSDTSLFIASVMYSKGYKIFWYHPKSLKYGNNRITCTGHYLKVWFNENSKDFLKYEIISDELEVDLSTFSCLMIRQNPPVDMHYIASTHLLSILKDINPNIFFINDPDAVRNNVEKLLPLKLQKQDIVPPTIISCDFTSIKNFLDKHKHIVMKPIYGYGGNDVIQVQHGEDDKILKYLTLQKDMQVIAQKFLPEIYFGDKRVIVCDGEIVGVVGRMPARDDFLTNTRLGGTLRKAVLTEDEKQTCEACAIELKKLGIFFAGIDLIGGFVTEINITSPTLLVALFQQKGIDSVKILFDKIEGRIIELDKKTLQ
jgi:glutathione synthase